MRSRTLRRIKIKIPGGASIIHYLKRKPSPARCAECKKPLHGVASKRPSRMKKLAKTKKVPSRVFGGNLCPSCTRQRLKKTLHEKSVA